MVFFRLNQTGKYFIKAFYSLFIVVMLCGFDTSRHSIPIENIYGGGSGKPKKNQLKKNDRVFGYVHNGQSRAYSFKVLNWHEIINDRVGGAWRMVTYCPLCGTWVVFDTEVKGRNLRFGVLGVFYQSDILLHDHQRKSLGSQIKGGDWKPDRLLFKTTFFHTYELGEREVQAPKNPGSIC